MSLDDMFRGDSTLVPGALRGYRAWRWEWPDSLQSTGMSHTWRQDAHLAPETAQCLATFVPSSHTVPNVDCRCGIYGWYDPEDDRIPHPATHGAVFGVVEASGRIILGTHGFRAEKARVIAVTSEDAATKLQLEDLGYEVHDFREDLLAAYPPEDVPALVQHDCDGTCRERAMGTAGSLNWQHVHVSFAGVDLTHVVSALHQASAAAAAFARAVAAEADHVRDADPRQHALDARRNRNTGPGGASLFRDALRRRS